MSILPYRPEFANESPYGAPQLDVPVCLNVNENPYPPSPELIADISRGVAAAAAGLNRYPDRDFMELREDLSAFLERESHVHVDPANIWAANGSNEVMLHVLQAFAGPGRTVVSFAPTYSMYSEYARDVSATWVAGARTDSFELDLDEVRSVLERERPGVVLLTSPNNPTGTALPQEQLIEILDIARHTGPEPGQASLVVIDEAYVEFRRDGVSSALELLSDYPYMAVSRTMSKAFGAAGLRLGYLAAAKEVIDQLTIVRLPYHLSALTQAAARACLAHSDQLADQIAKIREDRDSLVEELGALGLKTVPSDSNFVMFGTFADRHAVWQGILDRGVLIREVGPEGWLRVCIGTPQENAAFVAALKEVI
ncbi:histidinol-phosphate transaminase [Ancrocorticia populi]|uniref:Histidinol-phosphate aminotransferase n=1 Tax=Ancrocorticia populi TaxID=2175228 RepID=A0A2V1K5X0_9ACTO|nr:histidinol-phosphate transaminase [Ancrocorticia populi]PWF26439.1 histidinol-phosphate transaminase [Ancrocorticia populi]